jgi:hypothetical protein
MVSESGPERPATVTEAARLGLDAGLAVVCLGVVGFGLRLHSGIDFGPTAGWVAFAGVLLVAVGVSAVASGASASRSATAVAGPNPVLASVAGFGPTLAGAWTLLVLAPAFGWLYPPPQWVGPTLLALPTAVLCGTVGDLLARSSRGLSPDAYEDGTVVVPVLSMLVAVVLFVVSLPGGLWLDTARSGGLVGTGLPLGGAFLAGSVGTVTAGRRLVRASDDDWRDTAVGGGRRLIAGVVAGLYGLVVLVVAGLVTLPVFGTVAAGVTQFDLGPLLYGPALLVASAVGVELLGDALAPAPWLVVRVRGLLGESVEDQSLAATGETTRSLVAWAVGGLAGFACCAFGLFHAATALGAPGGVAGVVPVLVVSGAVSAGAFGGRRLSARLRTASNW